MNGRKLSVNKACLFLAVLLLVAMGTVSAALYGLTQNITAVWYVVLFGIFVLLCAVCFMVLVRRKLAMFSVTASSPGITILSRYEKQQEMAGYLLTSRIIAAGLSAVFLLIGIMNFINTMVVSVNTRKHEFATLESIGMTKKQIRNVLLWEGVYYWSISFLLLATLGTAIYIPIYSAFRRMVPYAAFHYPVISLLVVAAIVLLVCLATPVITFMQNVKQSVVERLRQN